MTILGTTDDWVWLDDVELQSDGKIVAAGNSGAFGSEDFTLVRYRNDGKPDESFGTGGRVRTSVAPNDDEVLKVALPARRQDRGRRAQAATGRRGTESPRATTPADRSTRHSAPPGPSKPAAG